MFENSDLKIHTLARLTIEPHDEPSITFVSQKAPVLFVYLLMHPREHLREALAEMFWSDTNSEQALKNLRTVLSNLQKFLGDYLDVTRQTLAIRKLECIWLDVQAFDSQLDAIVTKQKHPYSPRRLIRDLEQALALYQGDFLLGIKTSNAPQLDTWIMLEQERIRLRAAKAMLQLVEVALASGYYSQGIEYGRKLLAIEPFWEEAHRAMMTLLVKSGNRTAALQQYDVCVNLLESDLGVEPDDETQSLYHDIRTGRMKVADDAHQRPNNLQKPTTPYFETPTVIQQINSLLDTPNCRLLSILGQGGMGKTRLAQHLGMQRLEDYTDGVFFVSLVSLTIPELLPLAILDALGIDHQDIYQSPFDTLLSFLRRKHALLILDNFEHLLDQADMLMTLLGHAPQVQILLTSRKSLEQSGETLFQLSGMDFPKWETVEDAITYPAVKLFIHSAKRVQPRFDLTADNLKYVAQICRLVGGMPLAILLAASWLSMLSPEEIAEEISKSIEFLEAMGTDIPERQHSIQAVFDYSWQLLSADEQSIFMKLSIFRGGFTRDAAQKITDASLRQLMSLVNKSLLHRDIETGRFGIHELARQYAEEKLQNSKVYFSTVESHSQYYLKFMQEQEAHLQGTQQVEALSAISEDFENISRAWLRALEQGNEEGIEEAVETLAEYLWMTGRWANDGHLMHSAQDWFQAREGEKVKRVWRMIAVRNHIYHEDRIASLENVLKLSLEDNDEGEIALAHYLLGVIYQERRQVEQALAHYLASMPYYEACGDDFHLAYILSWLATLYRSFNKREQGRIYLDKGLQVAERHENLDVRRLIAGEESFYLFAEASYQGGEQSFVKTIQIATQLDNLGYEAVYRFFHVLFFDFGLRGNLKEAMKTIDNEYFAIALSKIADNSFNIFARLIKLSFESFTAIAQDDYETALQIIETYPMQIIDREWSIWAWVKMMIAVGQGDFEQLADVLKSFFLFNLEGKHLPYLSIGIAMAAIHSAEVDKQATRATELLALVISHPQCLSGWLTWWSYIAHLQQKLNTDLGDEVYQASWERGTKLDILETAEAWFEENST